MAQSVCKLNVEAFDASNQLSTITHIAHIQSPIVFSLITHWIHNKHHSLAFEAQQYTL